MHRTVTVASYPTGREDYPFAAHYTDDTHDQTHPWDAWNGRYMRYGLTREDAFNGVKAAMQGARISLVGGSAIWRHLERES